MGGHGGGGGGRPLDVYRVAVLRGGDRAAVTVAVVALCRRGLVEAAEPGVLRTTGPLSGRAAHPLEKAVHAALHRRCTLLELMARPRVRMCVTTVRASLTAEGLLRRRLPVPTRAGHRTLRELRAAHPPPVRAAELADDDSALTAVALHGDQALLLAEPHLARDAMLTGKPPTRRDLLGEPPDAPGGLTTRVYRELHDGDGGGSDSGEGRGPDGGSGGHSDGGGHGWGGGSSCGGGY
ncbi:TIGR04222 domain-containing membrane protein [Streptomyces abyssomicinicus]|uniref:TIGR04222 domain-containing membrane protein n=1 Tax=Streptomyces abyssomicinicus TaxID=574929 RepID=UPI0012504FA1|nr:TIGR04222 domain-containing membrane protein [Streptomyces abyssomicinicus]